MQTSILTFRLTFNGENGLFIERLHHHPYGPNPLEAVCAARRATTLEPGWKWMSDHGMGRPSLKSIAKIADSDGKIVCTPEILSEAIKFARKCKEDNLADYLEKA